jgi:preprotein translocase subunit SecG
MKNVVLVLHMFIAAGLVGSILLQRSEGGALGMGGGGGGAFMSGRAAGNLLTRATSILAAAFFATSISLTVLSGIGARESSVVERVDVEEAAGEAVPAEPEEPQVPVDD